MARIAKPKKEISMEEALWKSADKLRGSVEPAEYKHVVLSLFFLKFASDKFEECRNKIIADENNQPYEGRAIVKLFLKNKGVQDLFSGKIEADPNAKPEYIDIRKVSEGILTNLIPQLIKAGEKIGTVILEDGKEEPIIAEEDITIEAGTPVAVKMYARRGIIDERTPLFR